MKIDVRRKVGNKSLPTERDTRAEYKNLLKQKIRTIKN